jgi:hypothetical protein
VYQNHKVPPVAHRLHAAMMIIDIRHDPIQRFQQHDKDKLNAVILFHANRC